MTLSCTWRWLMSAEPGLFTARRYAEQRTQPGAPHSHRGRTGDRTAGRGRSPPRSSSGQPARRRGAATAHQSPNNSTHNKHPACSCRSSRRSHAVLRSYRDSVSHHDFETAWVVTARRRFHHLLTVYTDSRDSLPSSQRTMTSSPEVSITFPLPLPEYSLVFRTC